MHTVWIALTVFLIVAGAALVVGGGLTLFFRYRAGQPVQMPLRALLRVYLYILIIVGLLLFTQGFSELVRAGLGATLDKDYSYQPVFVPFGVKTARAPAPLELKDRSDLSDEERDELAQIIADREAKDLELRRKQRKEGLDRALKEGLIEGATFLIVGAIVWGVHVGGRNRLETHEERESPLNRVYLIAIVIIFAIITIVNLPQAVFETFRFYILDPLDEFSRNSPPGGKLALAIAALPIWILYLMGAIGAVRRGDDQ